MLFLCLVRICWNGMIIKHEVNLSITLKNYTAQVTEIDSVDGRNVI